MSQCKEKISCRLVYRVVFLLAYPLLYWTMRCPLKIANLLTHFHLYHIEDKNSHQLFTFIPSLYHIKTILPATTSRAWLNLRLSLADTS
jgi:hypothetical protein